MSSYKQWLLTLVSLSMLLLAASIGPAHPARSAPIVASQVEGDETMRLRPAPSISVAVDVEVRVVGARNLGAFEFDITFDQTGTQLTGVSLGNFLGQTSGCTPEQVRSAVALGPLAKGNVTRIGGYSYGTGDGANSDGLLAVLHFETGGATNVPVQITRALLVNTAATASTPAIDGTTLVEGGTLLLPLVNR